MKQVVSSSEQETMDIARDFGEKVEPGAVIGLYGDLGAGKTHFVKGFVRAFGIEPDRVNSPTFTIINEYPGKIPVYHFDCYRLKNPQEALEIGAEEYFFGDGVCIIEWPERIDSILPDFVQSIFITSEGPNKRTIIFQED